KQRDAANLQAFLALAKTWELNYRDKGKQIPDFLAYMAENATQEEFKQVSVEGEQNIQLLTIHKSKGLQFDQVFVLYDLSSPGRKDLDKLVWALEYADQRFDRVSDFALTFHYEDILKHSSHQGLWELSEGKALLEELNSLYVAFTRAKTRLHICFAYQSSKSWDEYLAAKEEDSLKLPTIVATACVDFFRAQDINPRRHGIYTLQSNPSSNSSDVLTKGDKQQESAPIALDPMLRLAPYKKLPFNAYRPIEQIPNLDWEVSFLHKRQNLIGDIVHFYLSFIKHDHDEEYTIAQQACLARYGSLLNRGKLQRILDTARSEIARYAFIFDPSYPHIFTEFTITGSHGTMRIDRLMVDPRGLRIQVIDFKTGAIHEKDQLDTYVQALLELPAFQNADYQIEQRYVLLAVEDQGAKLV
ncbi:MAG TPA: 3'-5' exonuclease, partial [Candidatus Cloacimonadota bacterium]|nr:3'-5' exonuclease [Candidatus Cloacimonadota bacterium]